MTRISRTGRISRHFNVAEFIDWHANRRPPVKSHRGLVRLVDQALEPARDRFGVIHVHSGYRTRATNTQVGGAPASRHLYDTFPASPAADISAEHATEEQLYDFLDGLGVGGLGLYRGHVHVDLRAGRARWADLGAE